MARMIATRAPLRQTADAWRKQVDVKRAHTSHPHAENCVTPAEAPLAAARALPYIGLR